MKRGKIYVVGIGPGSPEQVTPAVEQVLRQADVVVGYKYYFRFVEPLLHEGAECIDTGMRQERERGELAFERAEAGATVCMISSGDAGIYGMAPLLYEMRDERGSEVELETLPGISSFQMAAALLGAPLGHDFCSVSLSDLMTPWAVIERRIVAAAEGDFVTAVFNPRSRQRYWQLTRLVELFLLHRRGDTPVGIVYQAGRPEQRVQITTLDHLDEAEVDMLTMILIGNSQSYISGDHIVTPRGYYREEERDGSVGAKIMSESFHTILPLLKHADRYDTGHLWALLHAIHTTADFEMEELLHTDPEAVRRIYERISSGEVDTIVTDVTMVVSGIRKKALERYGLEAKCYLHDPRIAEMTAGGKLTRTQAGIRLAVKDHPRALFAFGNAPTALMELADLIHQGKAEPAGIIAAPVGFVHVCESKHMIKPFREIPKLIIEGRKGGSNLAATLCNAILSYDDAAAIRPGRDV